MASQHPHSTRTQSTARKARATHNGRRHQEYGADDLLRDSLEELRERSADIKNVAKEYIHQKPVKALGIAVLTGMALAILLKR